MKHLLKSFHYAFLGIKICLKQRNFKIQVLIAFFAVLFGFFFQITATEWCIILLCTGLVLALEMMNTATEHLVDFVSPGYHKTAGIIKDVLAGAVLISALLSGVIGTIIFWKYFLDLFNNL